MNGGAQLASLLRVRGLQADRARAQLVAAQAAEQAARAHDAATRAHAQQASQAREGVLSDMGRQTGALRDIFHFAALSEDHVALCDSEAADCAAAATAARDQVRVVTEVALVTQQALRAQQKTTELLTISRSDAAKAARQALARKQGG